MATAVQQINALSAQLTITDVIGEDLIATAYLKFQAEGMLEAIFHDRPPSLREFLDRHRPSEESTWRGCLYYPMVDGQKVGCELAGMGWCWDIRRYPGGNASGEIGMGFFRKFQQRDIASEFTRMMLDHCFGPLVNLDIVHGRHVEPNRAASVFALKMGFTLLPPVPLSGSWHGEPCASVWSYLTRERWEQYNRVKESK